ncbi:MAG: hypothetical protein R3E39_21305 [Anaerolineae bacterium]
MHVVSVQRQQPNFPPVTSAAISPIAPIPPFTVIPHFYFSL